MRVPALDAEQAQREMQLALVQGVCWLVALVASGLLLRELSSGKQAHAAWLALLLSLTTLLLLRRGGLPLRATSLLLSCALVGLITSAALDLGRAAGAALSLSFIPGFLAVLVLGPAWGWAVCGLMLTSLGWLLETTSPLGRYDWLRFVDEVAMTVFAAGLAHALWRSFRQYESAIAERQSRLLAMRENRHALAAAIFEGLEPLSLQLRDSLAQLAEGAENHATALLQELSAQLGKAKELARKEEAEAPHPEDADQAIRRQAMRVWMRLAALLMAFFVIRNFVVGVAFAPSIFTFVFCLLFAAWLRRPRSSRQLEWTALVVGVSSTGPMLAHIHAYGGRLDAPALVVMPGTVLFTALLSHGPAAWAVAGLNAAILLSMAVGRPLPLGEARLLGDLVLSFVAVVVSLSCVFGLRRRYVQTLLEQAEALALALRQHRRLAGTLFHDVSNHLQVLTFAVRDEPLDLPLLRSLGQRVERLIGLSKHFLLSPESTPDPALEPMPVSDAVDSLSEAFSLRLRDKRVQLVTGPGLDLRVRAQPELLVESVLGNLLSNAIKFSPEGASITLAAESVGPAVRIVLKDAGRGVPSEVLAQLGQDHALPSALGTAGERGQGFGLQLAREHLERMGGRLELKSSAEGGTEATVWLPEA